MAERVSRAAGAHSFHAVSGDKRRAADFVAELKRGRAQRLGTVNGHRVSSREARYLRYIAEWVVPRLPGDRNAKLDLAARVAWWSLKEGVLAVGSKINGRPVTPISFSNFAPNVWVDPLRPMPRGQAWQVGIAAIQVNAGLRSTSGLTRLARKLHGNKPIDQILAATAQAAGFSPADVAEVVRSTGDLRISWLLRIPAVAFVEQDKTVRAECMSGGVPTCVSRLWPSSAAYAPDSAGAKRTLDALRDFFSRAAPRVSPP